MKERKLKNNSILLISIIIFLSSLYVLPLFTKNSVYRGDDIIFHLTRFKMLAEEIKMGNYHPLVYHKMFCGYGYAAGLFYPDLFIYPFSVLSCLGVRIITCIKLYYVIINVFTGFSFFFCSRAIFKDLGEKNSNFKGFIVFLISMADPYKFYNYYKRAALGEFTAIIFVPIIVLGVYYIFKHTKKSYILGLGMAGLVSCHILSFIMACTVLLIFYLYNIKNVLRNIEILIQTLFAALQCALASAFIWVPMLEMIIKGNLAVSHTTVIFTGPIFKHYLVPIVENEALGIMLAGIIVVYSIFLRDIYNRLIQISLFSFFFCSNLFPWKTLSLIQPINTIQFPWRLSSVFYFIIMYYLYLVIKERLSCHKDNIALEDNSSKGNSIFRNRTAVKCSVIKNISVITISLAVLIAYTFIFINKTDFKNIRYISEEYCNNCSSAALLEYAPYDLVINNAKKSNPNISSYKLNRVEYSIEELNPGKAVEFKKQFIKSGYKIKFKTENNQICIPIINYLGYETDISNAKISTGKYGFVELSNITNEGTVKIIYKGTVLQGLSLLGPIIYIICSSIFFVAKKKKARY